jgi:hypothetical protein
MAANELIDFPLAAQRDTPRFPVSFSSKLPLAGALGISVRAGPYSWLADRQRKASTIPQTPTAMEYGQFEQLTVVSGRNKRNGDI